MNQSQFALSPMVEYNNRALDEEERYKEYNQKFGLMNPNLSNQVPAQPNYYKHRIEGIQFFKEDNNGSSNIFHIDQFDQSASSRIIKRLYINFDKDISHKMFGFRTRFVPEKMKSYMGSGTPSNFADQSHKPIESYVQDKMQALLSRYDRLEDYNTKQTIVKVLDSDNEDDEIEIEKNKRMIKTNQR